MASEVDICNLALAHLGDEAVVAAISPPDGSAQAAHCARFYPIARDAVLEAHNWRFALRRAALAVVSTTELPDEWAYAYAYPNCLKFIAVFPPTVLVAANQGAIFDQSEFVARGKPAQFVIEGLADGSQVIYTNMEDATGYYTVSVPDTTKFSPLCVLAISRLLASMLAGAIIKGEAGMKVARAQLEWYEKIDSPRAKTSDASASRNTSYNDFIPSGVAARL